MCLEEGTHSAWLHEILSPHVDELVVVSMGESKGQKNDQVDAFARAEQLRTGTFDKLVFKAPTRFALLRQLACTYDALTRDVVRALAGWRAYLRAFPRGLLAVEARYNLALCLLKTGRLAEAESALRAFAGRRFGSYRRQQARHLLAGLRPQQDAQ